MTQRQSKECLETRKELEPKEWVWLKVALRKFGVELKDSVVPSREGPFFKVVEGFLDS